MTFSPEFSETPPVEKKISEIWQNEQKYFPGDFSPEEISPGELSGICGSKNLFTAGNLHF